MVSNVVELSAGATHTCARVDDATARCWGRNHVGQLGIDTMADVSSATAVLMLRDVVDLAAGGNHTCARASNGAVLCWGLNDTGQVGDGSAATMRLAPVINAL